MLRQQFLNSYQFRKEQFCHPKQEAVILSLHFLQRAYYLLALFSARGHSEAGLKLGVGGFGSDKSFARNVLFIKELMKSLREIFTQLI